MILLALDPGIDGTGWAVFEVPKLPPQHTGTYRNALLESGTLRSGKDASLPERLAQLYFQLSVVVAAHGPDVMVVEVPAIDGMYARQRKKAKDTGSFGAAELTAMHRATGALILAGHIQMVETHTIRASKADKDFKTAWVVAIWPELANRKSNQDQRDAIFLGATALKDYATQARRGK